MLFVIDKPRFQQIIAIAREPAPRRGSAQDEPFLRLQADGSTVEVTSAAVGATIPATVYEEGVLFLRVSRFQRMLRQMQSATAGLREVAIQVQKDGLSFGDVRFGFDVGDMLLYPDVATAPATHPGDRQPSPPGQGELFGNHD